MVALGDGTPFCYHTHELHSPFRIPQSPLPMFSRIRWRIAFSYTLLLWLIVAAVHWQPTAVWPIFLLGTAVSLALAWLLAERSTQPIRRLTAVLRRFAAGDTEARILPTTRDEVGELIATFNQVRDQYSERVGHMEGELQRLSTVLYLMADGVLMTDSYGKVQLINPAALRILNITHEMALGHSFAEVVYQHQLIDLWQKCRQTRREETAAIEMPRRGVFVQAVISPFQEDGRVGCLVILQDLTRVRQLETVRRDFISNISHELRTPITALKALVETLEDTALDDPPMARRFLSKAAGEVDAMGQIVQELLTLSHIESGQVPLRLQPTLVSDLILPPSERLLPAAQRKSIELIIDLPLALPPVLVDVDQVEQVLRNLLHNAIKYTREGGRIVVSAVRQGDMVELAVRDTGIGIPEHDIPRIFERFYKADRARQREQIGGTGLGLAIAKHIIQIHGGDISVQSREGEGSVFYFTLPVAKG